MLNRVKFFNGYREKFGSLKQSKVDAIDFLLQKLDASERFNLANEYAYIFATIYHETNATFLPVIEGYWIKHNRLKKLYNYYYNYNRLALKSIFPHGLRGKTYEGRGYVQLTHKWNYERLGKEIGVDLFSEPDKAMEPEIAWKILEAGMSKGLFTGKKLSQYVNENKTVYSGARKVINGVNEKMRIAGYAEKFESFLDYE
jgi:predicted chitinase